MEDQQNLEAIMGLIMFGGNAKSDAMEAIAVTDLAKEIIELYRRVYSE